MLPKKYRLKINNTFKASWKDKKEEYTPVFKLVYRFKNRENPPRIGFIVTSKAGGATKRNKIKRWLGEAVLALIEKFPKGSETLLIVNKNLGRTDYEEIGNLLDQVLSKIYITGK